jgi:hypothetical protein
VEELLYTDRTDCKDQRRTIKNIDIRWEKVQLLKVKCPWYPKAKLKSTDYRYDHFYPEKEREVRRRTGVWKKD